MGVGQAALATVIGLGGFTVLVVWGALKLRRRRDLSDVLRDKLTVRVWNRGGRLTLVGVPWQAHDEDYEDCGCRSCYSVEMTLLQPVEVESLFLGRVDTAECHEMANRARRWVR